MMTSALKPKVDDEIQSSKIIMLRVMKSFSVVADDVSRALTSIIYMSSLSCSSNICNALRLHRFQLLFLIRMNFNSISTRWERNFPLFEELERRSRIKNKSKKYENVNNFQLLCFHSSRLRLNLDVVFLKFVFMISLKRLKSFFSLLLRAAWKPRLNAGRKPAELLGLLLHHNNIHSTIFHQKNPFKNFKIRLLKFPVFKESRLKILDSETIETSASSMKLI